MKNIADTCMALLNEGIFDDVGLAQADKGKILIVITKEELDKLRDSIEALQYEDGPHLNDEEIIAHKISLRCNEYPKVKFFGSQQGNMLKTKYYSFIISKK